MNLPSCFLPQPAADWGPHTVSAFEQLYAQILQQPPGTAIDYRLFAPKWQFLGYLCRQKEIVLHGTGEAEIAEFEPRQSNDAAEFGNRRAIYAASDGIWALYFAVVDRENYVNSLINGCFRIIEPPGQSGPYYFFSINGDALPHQPWRDGTVYLLPRAGFEPQPRQQYRGAVVEIAQWASSEPVRPLAKLTVGPGDFPFLGQIRGHDLAVIRERAAADPEGFPWLEELADHAPGPPVPR